MNIVKSMNFGNVITIVACLLAVGVSYGQTQTKIEALESREEDYENRILPLLDEVKNEVQAIRVKQAEMATDIEWLKNNSLTVVE